MPGVRQLKIVHGSCQLLHQMKQTVTKSNQYIVELKKKCDAHEASKIKTHA